VTTPLPSPDPKPAQPASRPARRTQAERRSETIGLLLRATTDCLVARGYANTTTQEVAHRAGLSQGAIFRHFASRQDLMVATAEHLSQTCMAHFETQLKAKRNVNLAELDAALEVLYEVVSTPIQAAWFELQVAARTDAELQLRMQPIFDHNRQANIAMAERLLPGLLEPSLSTGLGTTALTSLSTPEAQHPRPVARPEPQVRIRATPNKLRQHRQFR
jgi:AcrR family transcriptional regulator